MPLTRRDIVLLDGGFASQLSNHIQEPIDGHPLWSARFIATDPQAVIKTHLDYLRAGSQIITTSTYQASVKKFMEHLNVSEEEAFILMKKAVEQAQAARDIYLKENPSIKKPLIAGSIGPYGACLNDGSEYTGTYADTTPIEVMMEWHRPRFKALVEAGVDILAFETMPCKCEAVMLIELLKDYPDMKAWLSFSCRSDGKSISHGENFQETARHCYDLNKKQLIAVGVNCLSPILVDHLFTGLNDGREENPVPLIVYPNSGEIFDNKNWVGKENCTPLEVYASKWLDLGVEYIGGCCRTYAENISKIKEEIDKWKQRNPHVKVA